MEDKKIFNKCNMNTKFIVYSIHKVRKIGCTREDQWNFRLASHLRKYKNILPEDMVVMKIFDDEYEADQYEYDMQTKYKYNHDKNRYTHILYNMVPKSLEPKNLKKRVESYKQTLKERPELWVSKLHSSEARKKAVANRDMKAVGKKLMKTHPLRKPLKAWKDGEYVGKFEGVGDASRKLKIKGVNISNVANPNQKLQSWKGWTFKYIQHGN